MVLQMPYAVARAYERVSKIMPRERVANPTDSVQLCLAYRTSEVVAVSHQHGQFLFVFGVSVRAEMCAWLAYAVCTFVRWATFSLVMLGTAQVNIQGKDAVICVCTGGG